MFHTTKVNEKQNKIAQKVQSASFSSFFFHLIISSYVFTGTKITEMKYLTNLEIHNLTITF